ncbi:MAG: SWIM zinc finger family protein [Isosphaeraceae bacterium]
MGWYNDYGFKPYVPVAQRRREAQREVEKRRKKGLNVQPIVIDGRLITKTFWGKAWCENLESYSDFENRLPRGRTYVRNGSVVHLEIQPGKISALVSGSELYSVEITISSLPDPHWKCVKGECAGQIGSLVELLQGRLSKSVMDVVTRHGSGLFPKPAEIKMKCSCPDWAGMCKHVAAVMYGVGARFDDKPELLFVLRQVDHLELIAGAVDSAPGADVRKGRGKRTIAAGDLADVFGIEMAEAETPALASPAIAKKPAKPKPSAAKAAAKAKSKGAVTDVKKTARVPAAKQKKPKTAAASLKAAVQGRTKPSAGKRVKQPVS